MVKQITPNNMICNGLQKKLPEDNNNLNKSFVNLYKQMNNVL